jgi:hypothetical protein
MAAVALAACGGGDDSPDTDGGLSAMELAAKLPEGGVPQAVAVDVVASKEAAGVSEDADPIELGTSPNEVRLGSSAYFALFSLSAKVDNPVRTAMDNSQITAYAAHPDYRSDDSVALVSTTQDFEEIASALEDEGWERDGDVLTGESDAEGLTYDAVGAADGFVVLGYSKEAVEAVVSGSAKPSDTGEVKALEGLDAPVIGAVIPDVEGLECVSLVTFEDFVDGRSGIQMTVDGEADAKNISKQLEQDSASAGFTVASEDANGDTATIELKGRDDEGLANSPAILIAAGFDDNGPLLYDCE